jgi:hypothetical protein
VNESAGIDFRPVKALFIQVLPPGDPLREAAVTEPDHFPTKAEGLAKLTVYFRLWLAREAKERGDHG